MKKLKQRTSPKAEFKRELWAELEKEYDEAYGPLPSTRPARLVYRFAAVGVAVMVLFVTTGTGVYAYNSPEVSAGHALFLLKQGIEGFECGVFRAPERKAACHARMMQRRLDEAEIETDPTLRERILEHAADELGISVEQLRKEWANPENRDGIIEELSDENNRFIKLMNQLRRPDPKFEGLEERFNNIRQQILDSDLSPEQKQEIFQDQIKPIMQNLNRPRPAVQKIINQN